MSSTHQVLKQSKSALNDKAVGLWAINQFFLFLFCKANHLAYLCIVMPNTFFRFKQFVVYQDQCAMKVGTDSVLLGAWARGGSRMLDIGCGTGVIAMMMAQRFPLSQIDAVDIDPSACKQAVVNVGMSPFDRQVHVVCSSIQQWADSPHLQGCYDALVSNPPFFDNALKAPDSLRNTARHTDTLPFDQLFMSAKRLLDQEGEFSVIIPFDYKAKLQREASLCGFTLAREYAVKTTPHKAPKRYLLAFRLHPVKDFDRQEVVLEMAPGVRSEWYHKITDDFYL